MAQNNKPNGNFQRRNRDNYFKKELQQYRGSAPINFMANKDDNRRKKDCKAICRDLASGNIDIQTEAGYFLQPELIDQLCSFTYSKMYYHSVISESVEERRARLAVTMGPAYVDPNLMDIINMHARSYAAYSILYNGFTALKASGDAPGWLSIIVSQLSSGRYASNI